MINSLALGTGSYSYVWPDGGDEGCGANDCALQNARSPQSGGGDDQYGYGPVIVLAVEIWLCAACYLAIGLLQDIESALYFSTVTFATVGYCDIFPTRDWRVLAALEGINGFLLIGWSTAYLVAAGTRVGPFKSGEHF